ncbi:MAG TPA: DUF1552 domain-containing protein [Polyangia bacterium]|jgi:hypothetical protein|nr:DUF1552 domain-containing protein [Polyangia bacterium]
MSSRAVTRRSVLAGCAALPVLAGIFHPVRRAAMAAAVPSPKRLIIFGHTEGAYRKSWLPTGGETDFVLSDVLKPLEPWRSRLLVLDGFSNKAGTKHLAGDTHGKAISAALTGNTVTQRIEPVYIAPSESIDQFLGPKVQGPARLATAEITIGTNYFQNNGNGKTNALSYPVGGGNMMFGPDMPTTAFDRLFGGAMGGPTGGPMITGNDPAAEKLRLYRQSVLDSVTKDLSSMLSRLGTEDAKKVQGHLDAIRDIEKQITAPAPAVTINCKAPQRPVDPDIKDRSTVPKAVKLQIDLIVQALACDVTRVITFCPSDSGFTCGAPWLGESRDIHLISHDKYPGADWPGIAGKLMTWMYQQQAYLMQQLASIPEGDGTLLDHTLIYAPHEFGDDSGQHSYDNLLLSLAGDAGGYLKTGRFVTMNGKAHNNVLVTIANAMGVAVKTFGDATLCDGGPVPGLLA